MKNNKVLVQNGELDFKTYGSGEPLILIHAGFTDHRDWKYQIHAFSKSFYTIVYDQRGAGNSSVPTIAFCPAEDLKALMDHLNISKAILVGHSVGGTVALDFSLQYPDMVSSLVLVASGLNGYSWSEEYQQWYQSLWNEHKPEEITRKLLSTSFYEISKGNAHIKSEVRAMTAENIKKILAWKTLDIRCLHPQPIKMLKDVKIPTLVVCGSNDAKDIQIITNILAEHLGNAKISVIHNTGHFLNFEKYDELNDLIINFLSNVRL